MADQKSLPPSHLIPLDFDSIQSVPESHFWPDSDKLSSAINLDEKKSSLPLVDLLEDGASELIGRACEQWGMFQLINHGVPKTLIAKTEEEALRFFTLPTKEKMKALQFPGNGNTGYAMGKTSKYYSKRMWHEGFTIFGSPIDHAKKLWPSDFSRFCDTMVEYQSKMKDLSDKLIRLVFKFLDIPEEGIMKLLPSTDASGKPYAPLRMNSYPPCPDPDRVMGLAPHTDFSFFTIVHQARNNGLQVFKDGVGWISLSPVSGSLIVNVGDLLQILSNGRFRSILHRVIIQGQTKHRLSLAYFYDPPAHVYISPHIKPLSESPQIPLYRCVNVKEYFTMKDKNKGKGFDTIKI